MSGNRLKSWSATAVFLIGAAYVITLAIGFAVHGLSEPIVDPILAVMEVLTLLSIVVMAAVHGPAPRGFRSGFRRSAESRDLIH